MTTLPTEAALEVPVTQADRDAAADLISAYWQHDERMQKLAQSYRDGHTQGVWALAFARHRLASTSNSALVERCAQIAERYPMIDGQTRHDVMNGIARQIRLLATPPEQDRSTSKGEGA